MPAGTFLLGRRVSTNRYGWYNKNSSIFTYGSEVFRYVATCQVMLEFWTKMLVTCVYRRIMRKKWILVGWFSVQVTIEHASRRLDYMRPYPGLESRNEILLYCESRGTTAWVCFSGSRVG